MKKDKFIQALLQAKHIYIIGDGGSAALADHFACDLLKNAGLPAISLCSNSALITAISNDYHFDESFSLQLNILFNKKEDILVVFSTSGLSLNLIKAVEVAGIKKTISVVGENGRKSPLSNFSSISFIVEGIDQMDIENNMLSFCHKITRILMGKR